MQNSSPSQMKMLTSRMGENSKMVITGDLKQTDRRIEENGLYDLIRRLELYKSKNELETIKKVEFCARDIERSKIVQDVINIYNYDLNEKEAKMEKINGDSALIPINHIRKPNKIWE